MEFQDTSTPSFEQYWNDINKGNPLYTKSQYKDAYDTWASMYYPNAYQTALLNYQNEWQSPVNQMLRYQKAGLNPYSFQAQQSASGSQGAQLRQATGHQEMTQKRISNVLSAASSVSQVMSAAKEIYDYIKFGKDRSMWQTALTQHQVGAAAALSRIKEQEAAWSEYWNGARFEDYGYDEEGNPLLSSTKRVNPETSPRAQYMQASTGRINAQISQLSYLVNFLYPSQKQANEAKAALVEYQKEIAQGRYDAVLKINTGNKTADSILRMIGMWLLQSSLSFSF